MFWIRIIKAPVPGTNTYRADRLTAECVFGSGSSVADPHHFDEDLDPARHFDADPDANPDPIFNFDANPNLSFTLLRMRIRIVASK